MHYNRDQRGVVHAGSSSLPGNRGNAFLNVTLGAEIFWSPWFFSWLIVNLWVKRGPAFVFQARKGNRCRARTPLPASQTVSAAGPQKGTKHKVVWLRPNLWAGRNCPVLISQAQSFDLVNVRAGFVLGTLALTARLTTHPPQHLSPSSLQLSPSILRLAVSQPRERNNLSACGYFSSGVWRKSPLKPDYFRFSEK